MRPVYSLFVCALLFSSTLFAYTRGLQERIDGHGQISQETTITLGGGVTDFSGVLRKEITLKTPHTQLPGSNLILDQKRSIKLLDSYDVEELESGLRDVVRTAVSKQGGFDDVFVLANFVHHMSPADEQDFFIAIIAKDIAVERVIFQVEWFANGAGAHNQVRMILNQPITLIPQKAHVYSVMDLQNEDGKADIVYSLQAARVEGGEQNWGPLSGLLGEFANALQFFSVEAKAKRQIYDAVIDQYELSNLSASQKRSIFDAALTNSDSLEETTIYHTVLNSCVTHAILALRGKLNTATGQYEGIKNINPLIFNPYTVIAHLKETVVNDSTGEKLLARKIIRTMNEEFSQFSAYGDIFTEQRRRSTKAYQIISPLEKTLFADLSMATKVEDIVRKISVYIIDNNITYSEVVDFVSSAKKVASGEVTKAQAFKAKAKAFYEDIEKAWNLAVVDPSKHPMTELLDFLSLVQTQDLEKASVEGR